MRLKDYSMRIKKNIAVFLHILFLFMAILSISVMYLNTNIGSGMSWILDRKYDDSAPCSASSSRRIWITFSNMLPTATSLRQTAIWISSKEMFAVSRDNGPEITYTLEEVLRYAKSQGFYLNDQFEVVNDHLYLRRRLHNKRPAGHTGAPTIPTPP